ncbi:MAG: hypothetical protein ACO3OW_14250, partial [bacterium]
KSATHRHFWLHCLSGPCERDQRYRLVKQGIGLLGHLFMKMNFLCTTPLQATYQPNLSDVRFRPCAQHAT